MASKESEEENAETTKIHVMALDGLVNVNSIFTIAVFLGLSLASPGQRSLLSNARCDASLEVDRQLVLSEVVSFSAFLFSSLIAQALKLAIVTINSRDLQESLHADVGCELLRAGLVVSAVGSIVGCVTLTISMVLLVEIKLGVLSCHGWHAMVAVAALVILVPVGLLAYISIFWHAFLKSNKSYSKTANPPSPTR